VPDDAQLSRISESCEDGGSFSDDVVLPNDSVSVQQLSKSFSSSTKLSSPSPVSSSKEQLQPAGNTWQDNTVTVSENIRSVGDTAQAPSRPKSCLKTPPIIGKKPELFKKSDSVDRINPAIIAIHVDNVTQPDVSEMVKQITDLKQKLETERRRNAELEQQLTDKNVRIEELTTGIKALNEDLDAADEECRGLESENKALLMAMRQLKRT